MSEFAQDPARLCRTKGHQWKRPFPQSSYHEGPHNQRSCLRCGVGENDLSEEAKEKENKVE